MTRVERPFGHDAAAPAVTGFALGALAADVVLADEDLRHRASPGLLDEPGARLVVRFHVDLLVGDPLLVEEALGANAVRTPRGRVDLHRLHTDWMRRGEPRRKGLERAR